MDTHSAHPHSKFGIVALILSILGCVISLGSLLLIVFIMGAGGGLDILYAPMEQLNFVMYSGLFLGVIGGVLGFVSLTNGERNIASRISIILGTLMLCVGVLLTGIIMGFNSLFP